MARYRKTEIWKSVDWLTILLYLLLIVAGWFSICGASYEFDHVGLFDPSGRPGMQLIWIATSFVLIFVILMLDSDFFDVFAYFIYGFVVLLLIATIFLAPNIKGSHSWLVLGPIRLQPAELAKFATALAVAKYMDTYGFKLTTPKNFLVTLTLIFVPMVCILLQRETLGLSCLFPDVVSGGNDWICAFGRYLRYRLFCGWHEVCGYRGGYNSARSFDRILLDPGDHGGVDSH